MEEEKKKEELKKIFLRFVERLLDQDPVVTWKNKLERVGDSFVSHGLIVTIETFSEKPLEK